MWHWGRVIFASLLCSRWCHLLCCVSLIFLNNFLSITLWAGSLCTMNVSIKSLISRRLTRDLLPVSPTLIVNQFNSDLDDFITQHCKPRLLANIDPRKMKLFSWGQDICMYLRYPAILNRPRVHVSTWPDTCPNGNRRGLQVRIGFGSLHKNFEVCALQFQPKQSQSLSWI